MAYSNNNSSGKRSGVLLFFRRHIVLSAVIIALLGSTVLAAVLLPMKLGKKAMSKTLRTIIPQLATLPPGKLYLIHRKIIQVVPNLMMAHPAAASLPPLTNLKILHPAKQMDQSAQVRPVGRTLRDLMTAPVMPVQGHQRFLI